MNQSAKFKQLKDSSLVRFESYINGSWMAADKTFAVTNPATGEKLIDIADHGKDSTVMAVKAAKNAQKYWAQKTSAQRFEILNRWYRLIIENQDDLATIMTLEQGKPKAEALGEITYGANFVQWFAEQGKRVNGEVLAQPSNDRRVITIKQPVGVVGAVTPWNFPSSMITRKAAPALAAGCSIIVKPSELTPLSAIALAILAERAGMPAGVFNLVIGTNADSIGKVLTTHSEVAKFSFTGSTKVGKQLLEQCASTVKRVSLELGGNAPLIVFADADIDAAVDGVLASKYRNTGQTCVCTNRLLVDAAIYDDFAKRLKTKIEQLKMGNGLDKDVQIGPLISTDAVSKIEVLIDQAKKAGAQIQTGTGKGEGNSRFFKPTLITDVTNNMDIAQNEIFGPVLTMLRFSSEEEAIAIANDTRYGLAAYFYSRDIGRCYRVMEQLEYGMVGVNAGVISNPIAPFGGVKESGLGREGGHEGIDEYLEIKYTCFGDIN